MSKAWHELLMQDHETTERVFAAMESAFAAPGGPAPTLVAKMHEYLRGYVDRCHNMKEERHLFPLMEKLGIPREGGPLGMMLLEHEKGRGILARLTPLAEAAAAGDRSRLEELRAAFGEYAALCHEHFWKENDILYPMALRVMGERDGAAVVRGIEEVESGLGPQTRERYYQLAEEIIQAGQLDDLSAGLAPEVLAAILNTLPVELSFVDENDTVRYYSHERSEKIFARTRGVIGTQVQNCHPQKSVHVVNQLLADFKAGKREAAEFWIDLNGRKVHIRYWPVRSPEGRYLGCLETVQDVTAIQKLAGQRLLLDQT
ncbi:MAG TPA: PAS domain-containing protein [Candidatus Saccharimonadales bacterium]|nr:PAS domain-containing protein [Candidatus Saccharimonadales bacterium]